MLVHIADTLYSVHLGFEDVAVEGEAVAYFHGFHETAPEAIDRVHLVSVVLLKDGADRLNCLQVLVWLVSIHIVQRARIRDFSIRSREVNCNLQTYLASSKDVVQEGHSLLYHYLINRNCKTLIV